MTQKSFSQLEKEYNQLWMDGKIEEVLEKVKEAREQYPEEEYTTNLDLAVVHIQLGNLEETKKIIEKSLDEGILYPKMYFHPILEKVDFKDLFHRLDKLREELQKDAKSDYIVVKPEGYTDDKEYPLFIALHGWGEDAEFFRKFWTSKRINKEFILVLPQSSQVVGSKNYGWDNTEIAYNEIKDIYEDIKNTYKINYNKIIVGGFSQGSTVAISIALNKDLIPVKGFISLCPNKPEGFTEEAVIKARDNGVKGVILTGEKDQSISQQKEMVDMFKNLEFSHQFNITENLGHWFPEDLSDQIDESLNFILR